MPLPIRYLTTDMARAEESSQLSREAARARERPGVGVAVDAQHPGDFRRDLSLELQHCLGQLVELALAGGVDLVVAGIEQHFRLEDETVADHADVGALRQDFSEATEEVGTIAGQFLHPLGQRHVEATAEVGDLGRALPVSRFGGIEGVLERGDLAAERGDLLVEQLDLGQRPLADALLVGKLGGQRLDLAVGGVGGRPIGWRSGPEDCRGRPARPGGSIPGGKRCPADRGWRRAPWRAVRSARRSGR